MSIAANYFSFSCRMLVYKRDYLYFELMYRMQLDVNLDKEQENKNGQPRQLSICFWIFYFGGQKGREGKGKGLQILDAQRKFDAYINVSGHFYDFRELNNLLSSRLEIIQ